MPLPPRRFLIAGAVVGGVAAGGLGTYLSTDGRAKDARKAVQGPPPVPVTVEAAVQETVPVSLQAIGNVEAYTTVAVKSRVDGQIVNVQFREGQEVKKNQVLFQIDPRPFEAALRQAEAQALPGGGINSPIASGRVAFLDNAVDQTTGTIKVRAIFDNEDAALWPGQYYTVRVKLYDQNNAIMLPSRALQTGPNGQFVYVVKPDMTVEVRKVVVARIEGDHAILAGNDVAKDEKVVTRGALRLAPGAKVNIIEASPAS